MSLNQRGSPKKGRERLAAISAQMNTKFGAHIALPLNQAAVARVIKLPFGILELDWLTGGGVPLNRITRIWGKPSSLKSTTCLRLVRNGQHFCRHCKLPIVINPNNGDMDCACPKPRWTLADLTQFNVLSEANYEDSFKLLAGELPANAERGGVGQAFLPIVGSNGKKTKIEFVTTDRCEPFRCLYIDSESSIDEAWARANGVDTSLLMLMGGNWAEQVLDMTEDIILTNEVDLVIIDSLDMLTPGDTLVKALSQTPRIAGKANIMARAMQKWTSAINAGGLLNRYAPTIVIVAQVRAHDIGKPWASIKPSGGWAVGHGISLDVKLEPHKYEYKGSSALFGTFGCNIAKSKVGGFPRSKGKFRFWLRPGKGRLVGDTEDIEIVLEHAINQKLITKVKNKYKLESKFITDTQHTLLSTQKAVKKYLSDNLSVYLDLRNRVLSYLIGEDISITLPSEKIDAEEQKTVKKKKMKTVKEVKEARKKQVKSKTSLDDEILSCL